MAVDYEMIRPHFEELRNFILNDLQLLVSQKNGGNYITACLIACACEAMSWLRYGVPQKGELFFKEMMLPDKWKPVASSLYSALRDGIVHGYNTKTIIVGSRRGEIAVSWRNFSHLMVHKAGAYIYLNMQTMATDLKSALQKYEAELKADPKLRERYFEVITKMKNKWEKQPGPKELETWKALLPREAS
jgi:hypothetical protein